MNVKNALNARNVFVVMMSMLVAIVAARAESGPDSWTTIRVKANLNVGEGARASSISVATVNGHVTLHGTVPSQAMKTRAAAEAGRVAGVVGVRNLLQVVTARKAARVPRSDNALKADIRRALSADRSLADSRIVVNSVSHGDVFLGGSAASSTDIARALRLTAGRLGVRRVFSDIEAFGGFALASGAGTLGASLAVVPSGLRDSFVPEDEAIRQRVVKAIYDLDAQENETIHVSVTDGVVRLNGSVPTPQGNVARIDAARSVAGVRSVVNAVRLVPLDLDAR